MAFAFEKLVVYQRAVDFADSVATLTATYPRGCGYLAEQLNRAAVSVAANLAEGNGRSTRSDRRRFFLIARGSIQECVPLLELSARRSLIDPQRHAVMKNELEEIARMLAGLIRGLSNQNA